MEDANKWGKMTYFWNKFYDSFNSLKSSPGHGFCNRIILWNQLSSTTPFGGQKDTLVLTSFRHFGKSKRRPVSESFLLRLNGHQGPCQEPSEFKCVCVCVSCRLFVCVYFGYNCRLNF